MSDAAQLKSILILDDDGDFRKLLITILSKKFEGVTVTEYDPVAQGVPDENFNWSKYDVLLLDYHLSIPRTTGLDILQINRKNELFPATVMLTAAGNEEIAVRAIKAGVHDYLRKEYLDKERLHSAILDAFEKHQVERDKLNELTSQSHAFNKALFYQELEQKDKDKNNRVLLLIKLDKHDVLEKRLGIIFRDNIIRHIAKQSFEVFKSADCNPSITRFGDASVAMLIDEPKSRNTMEFHLEGLCAHLGKHPYRVDGKNINATVSIGVLCLSDKQLNAEDYINHALIAARKASAEEGYSFYLYRETDWQAIAEKPVEKNELIEDDQVPVDTQAEARQLPEPVTEAGPEPITKPGGEARAPAKKETVPPPQPVTVTAVPEKTAEPVVEPIPVKAEPTIDSKSLTELLQSIKTAFEEKRAVQIFQPVIPLSHEENDQDIYIVAVQLVNKDGSILPPDELKKVAGVPAFRKFLDRWMLREIIGRLVNRKHEGYIFFINISAESIADATFFNWLRTLLKGLDKINPGKQIILEISAREILNIQKQTTALMSFFKKSHGFRFILAQPSDIQQIQNLCNSMQFDLIRGDYELINKLNTTYTDVTAETGKRSLLQQLKESGVHIVVDDVVDATKLTDTITLGSDYASGAFIGEPEIITPAFFDLNC
ncbi:MAG: hypothetical protein HW386_547 [Gammaproteobacteria bacterium]|nr:hypothetical protein [Gammaproteobacteria bacterium]